MDDLTRDADLDHHLFRPNSYGSRPFYAAAYTVGTIEDGGLSPRRISVLRLN